MMTRCSIRVAAAIVVSAALPLSAQNVSREHVPGIVNFARVETTVACGGATRPEAMAEIRRMGFKSVINVRLADEPGADVAVEEAAAKAAGLRYVHVPFRANPPDVAAVDPFLRAVTTPENTPAYIHCALAGRAASLWLIKRVMVDRWDETRALQEAMPLGLSVNDRLRDFALDYIRAHPLTK